MKKIYTAIFVCLLACTNHVFAQVNPATLTGNGNLVKVDPSKIDPKISAMLNFYDKDIYFTQNKGQWTGDVLFKADFPLGQAVATPRGMVVGTYDPQAVEEQSAQFERKEQAEHDGIKFNEEDVKVNAQGWIMNFLNHSQAMHIEGKTEHKDYSNYFEGRDASKYANNVSSYQEIWYENVYNNVDVRYYPSKQGTLEYDIVCKPGFNKNDIALQLTGINNMYLKNNGHLVLHTTVGDMEFPTPVAYQKINGVKKPVAAKYILRNNVLRFDVGAYDAAQPLIIDPIALRWATWMTNNSTQANHNHCIWVDQATGYIYVIARVASSGLITVNPLTGFSSYQGTGDDCEIGEYIEPDTIGNPGEREWQTYLGGNAEDNPYALEQAANGDLIFTGYTQSTNFPLIGGLAYTGGGASINDAASSTKEKIFVTKINTAGNSFKSAVIGGNGVDAPFDLRTTTSSDILVCGNTTSTNLGSLFTGATNRADNTNGQDVIVFRINNDLSSVTWMDNYGGTGFDGATIMNTNLVTGDIFVAGRTTSTNFPTKNPRQSSSVGTDDGFIQKLNSNGGIVWSSYFQAGGSKDSDAILCMELNTTGTSVYIGGITNGLASTNISSSGVKYPTKTGTVNFFVAKMDTNQHFDEATYLGGGNEINMMGLNLDLNNDVYILGYTASNAFPVTTANALQKSFRGGGDDETFTKLRTDLDSLDYSTYFGGSHDDYDPVGERGIKFFNCRIFTVFTSESNNVPLTAGARTTNKISGSTVFEPGICVWANPPDLANNTITTSQHICKGSIPASFTGSVPSYILPQISRNGVDSVYPVTLNSATTYDWQSSTDSIHWFDVPGGTTQNLSNSLIGTINQTTYFRRIIGGDACIIAGAAEQTVVVTVTSVGANITNVSCHGAKNGSITAVPTGPAPYTVKWNTGATSLTISSLDTGTYSVTITDGNSCTYSNSFKVTQPDSLKVSIQSQVNPTSCAGGNGSITANTPTGGTAPYKYQWSPSGGTGLTASNLTSGTYTITVTDNNGCTTTASATLNPPVTINVSIKATSGAVCTGSPDTLNAIASGGTGKYTYAWTPGGSTHDTIIVTPTAITTYTVIATDGNNCSNSAQQIVNVNPLPTVSVTASPSSTICNGSNTTLTATGATSYTWSPATGLNATTGSSVTASPTANTTYTVTGKNATNCTNTTTIIVHVNPLPTISVPTPSPICNGTSTTLTASGATTYTWSPATGLSATTGSSVSANPTANTTYTITGTNATNCTNSTTVVVAVNQLPTISVPTPSPICNGTSTTLTASGATTYTWLPATGLSATTGSSVSASPTANTTYTITGTDGNNCTNSTTVVVGVNQLPTISVPTPSPICNGTSTTLTASGATTYTWSPATGLNATTGSSVSASPTANTTYTITGTDGNNCINSTTVVVGVNQLPTISVPTPSSICNGTSTTLTASGATTYTWSPATGLSATTGSSVSASPTANTTYTITGTDGNNCINSTTVVVAVNQLPTISVPTPSPICNGTSTTLTASGATTYTWSPATGLNATTGSSVSASPTANTTYTITGTDGNNCINSTTVVVAVNQLPTISVPTPSPICNGTSTTLTASGATTYTWSPATGLNATTGSSVSASPTANTTYTITGTDGNNCINSTTVVVAVNQLPTISVPTPSPICNGTSTTLTASGATTYTWSPATGLNATTGSSVSASPTANTTYTITGTDGNNCINSTTVVVAVNQLPTISVPTPSPICNGTSTTLTASGATTYTWSPATGLSATTGSSVTAKPSANTTYTIVGSDGNICSNSDTVVVAVNQLPTISVPTPTPICNGTSTTLTASGAISYTWSPATGLSATTGSSVSASPTANTTYTITGTDGNNCTNSTTVTVSVNQLPTISVPTPSPICNGTSTTLTASGATTYTWSPTTGLSATTGSSVSASPTANTTYTITGTDGNICSNSDTVVVAVNQLPTISVPTPSPICNGTSTTLTASGATTYTWIPATGLSATTGSSVSASPTANTTYTITGTDGNNCINSTTVLVAVNQLPTISVPTPSPICNGTSTTLTASGATTYTWSPATGLSATTGSSVTASPSTNTTYTIVGSDGNICSNSTTVVVAVNQLPTISVPAPSAPICNGTSTTLTASGATTYTWSPATGLSATTGSSVSASPTANTTYTITGTDGNNCINTTTVVVAVNPLPTVTISSSAPAICSGSNDTLIASGGVSYTWSPSTTLNATAGDTVIANPTVNTTYTVTGTDGNGCINTGTVAVNIIPAPQVNTNVEADTTCVGVADTLKASGGDSYIWFPSTGLSATSGSEVVATPTSPIVYTVVAINNSGCVSLNPTFIVLTVNPLPTVIVDSAVICSGTSATLTASGATTYTWSPATGLNATTGSSVTTNPTATTTYTVIGTNDNGCVDTAIALVTVNTTPSVQVNTPAPICTGNSTSLTASGADNYTWSPATGLDNTTGSSVNASPTSTTTYQIIGSTIAGCADTISVIVNVNTKPNVQVNTPDPICTGNSTPLTATGAATYTWSPATGLDNTTGSSVNASPTSNITYQVIGVSGTNCSDTTYVTVTVNTKPTVQVNTPAPICSGNSAVLTASGADTYTWTPATGLNNTIGSSVNASPNSTTTYQVIGTTTAGCADTTSVIVNVNTTPSVQVNTPAPICSGNSTPLTATGADNYTWSPATGLDNTSGSSVNASPTSTTTYQIIGTTIAGCADTISVIVNVNTKPNVQVNTPAPICAGNSAPLTATGAANYVWSPATGLDNTTGSSVNASPASTTTYQVIGVSGASCADTTYVIVTVNPLPTISVSTPTGPEICNGSTTLLMASGATTYTWSPTVGLSPTSGSPVLASPTTTTTYTVTGTDDNKCVNTGSIIVIVDPLPTITVSANPGSLICTGSSTTLTASGATTYTWSPATGLNATSGSSITADPTVNTTYTVTGTNANNCVNTRTIVITVEPLPSVSVSAYPGANICTGSSTTLTASGASTYTWSPATGLSATTGSSVTADPTTNTTYTVTGTNNNNCVSSNTIVINVSPLPTVSVSAYPTTTLCNGGSTTLTATGATTYTWSPNSGLSATTGSSVVASPTSTVTYTVTGANGNNCTNSATIKITVNPQITVTVTAKSASVCPGSPDTLTASGATNYTWSPAATLNASTGAVVYASPTVATTYTVTGSNGNGCTNSATVAVKINSPTCITKQPQPETLCSTGGKCSGSVTFCVTATGSNLNYQWQFNGHNIGNSNSPCYTINPIVLADTGNYDVIVTGSCGSVTSNTVKLKINASPTITLQPQCATVCSGNSTQFCVTASGTALKYQWQFNGKNITNATSPCYTASNAGCYDVVVSNSCGSVTSTVVTLTINTPPVITCQPKSESVCSVGGKCSGSVTFCVTATGSNLTYQWQYNGKNINRATSSCYTINPVIAADSGCYDVVVSNSCSSVTSSVAKLTIGSAPVIIYQPQCATICSGNTTQLCVTAIGLGLTYQWQFNGKNISKATSPCYTACNAGCYDVVISNSCGSVTSNTATVTINTPPVITCQPKGESLCSVGGKCSGSVTFCVTATGTNLTYQWLFNGTKIHNATSSCYTINPVTTSNAGCYTVTVSNSCGSVTSSGATLTIGSSPVITYQPQCSSVCAGNSATFCVTAVGTGLSYQWQFNGKNIGGANSCCYTISSAASCNAGCYDVVVSNSCSSVTSCTVTLTVNTPPCITTQPICLTVCAGSSTTFSVTANGSNLTYQWQYKGKNIGGANSSTYTVSSATTSEAGNYDVVVSNSCGCVTSNTVTLTVNNCSTCNTPTNLCSSDITCTGVKLSWSYSSSASSFTVEYRVHGCSTWTTVKVTTNCLTLNCLNSGITYDWSVSENCSCGSSSSYAGVVSFCTSNNCCVNMDVAVKKVDDGSAIGELKIYPNPTFSTTTVEGSFNKASDITIMVTDLSGRVLMSENESVVEGDYTHQLDMSKQPAGTYFLIIRTGDKMVTSRIVKIE